MQSHSMRGHMNPMEDLCLSHTGGITAMINSLAAKETYHRYSKTIIAILKYSLMAIQRFCQGDAQVRILRNIESLDHPSLWRNMGTRCGSNMGLSIIRHS